MKLPPKALDESGRTFGRLTVVAYAGRDANRNATWSCECACGRRTTVIGRNLRNGNTTSCGCARTRTDDEAVAAFWAKVRKTRSCWVWTGAKLSFGYGHLLWRGRYRVAHHVAYELLIGPVPDGLVTDHLCRNPACVNPEHLEPVIQRVNVIDRGSGPFAQRARQTHCKRGHEFSEANTYIHKSRGVRICRTCHRDRVSGRI